MVGAGLQLLPIGGAVPGVLGAVPTATLNMWELRAEHIISNMPTCTIVYMEPTYRIHVYFNALDSWDTPGYC